MLVEFSMPELGLDVEKWIHDDTDPWNSLTLDVDPIELERGALGLFSQTADLLAAVAAYLDERKSRNEQAFAV
jgi:hypothetical protein